MPGSALALVLVAALLAGYRASDLTIVYPVARGSAPTLSALAAVVLLDEKLGVLIAVGPARALSMLAAALLRGKLLGEGERG